MKLTVFGTEFGHLSTIAILLISCLIFFSVGVKTGWEIDDRLMLRQEELASKAQPAPKQQDPKQQHDSEEQAKSMKPPYDSLKFRHKLICTRPVEEIRRDNYGASDRLSIELTAISFDDKEMLDIAVLDKTIRAVMLRMPNIKSTSEVRLLVLETMITETFLTPKNMRIAEKLYKNYGLGQFTILTAKETLAWLKAQRKDVYDAVMSLYDNSKDLKENLNYNVPFSVAMTIQYYWRICPDLYRNIGSKEDRAKLWKGYYNTPKGLGTVNAYINRVKMMKKKFPDEVDWS